MTFIPLERPGDAVSISALLVTLRAVLDACILMIISKSGQHRPGLGLDVVCWIRICDRTAEYGGRTTPAD